MCDWFGHLSLRLLCEGGLAGMGLSPPCTLVTASSCVYVPGPPAGPCPPGLFPTLGGGSSGPLFETEGCCACFSGCCEVGTCRGPPASSRVWRLEPKRAGLNLDLATRSHVTVDRDSICFELQFLHLYNGDNYCCFICHPIIIHSLRALFSVPGTGDTKINHNGCLPQTGGILYVKNNAKVNAKPQARHAEHGEVEVNWGLKFGHAFAPVPALILSHCVISGKMCFLVFSSLICAMRRFNWMIFFSLTFYDYIKLPIWKSTGEIN